MNDATDLLDLPLSEFCDYLFSEARSEPRWQSAPTIGRLCAEAVWHCGEAIAQDFLGGQYQDASLPYAPAREVALARSLVVLGELLGAMRSQGFAPLVTRAQMRLRSLAPNKTGPTPLEFTTTPLRVFVQAAAFARLPGPSWAHILPVTGDVAGCGQLGEDCRISSSLDPDTAQAIISRLVGAFHMLVGLCTSKVGVAPTNRILLDIVSPAREGAG